MRKISFLLVFFTSVMLARDVDQLISEGKISKVREIVYKSLRDEERSIYYYYAGKIALSGDSSSYYYTKALEADPFFSRADSALYFLSQIKYTEGQYFTCSKYLRQFLNIYKKSDLYSQANFLLGKSLLARKKFTESLGLFSRLSGGVHIDPHLLSLAMADANFGLGRFGDSYELLKELYENTAAPIDRILLLERMTECASALKDDEVVAELEELKRERISGKNTISDMEEIEEQATVAEDADVEDGSRDTYYCQVGAFSSGTNAENLRRYLDELGYPAVTEKLRTGEDRTVYLIMVGPFGRRMDALRTGDKLKIEEGLQFIIKVK